MSGLIFSKVVGTSMRPLFWGGRHWVAGEPLRGEPRIGDILMFRQVRGDGEHSIVHRLVEMRDEGGERLYITRGDNCLGCEEVRRSDIIGRVSEVHRLSGWRPWHAIPARKFRVDGIAHRLYTRLWMATWPLRRLLLSLRLRMAKWRMEN